MSFDAGTIETHLDMDRTPFNQGLDKAEKDARDFERKKFKVKVDASVDKAQLKAELDAIGKGKKPKVEIDADIDQDKVVKQVDEIAKNTKKTADRSGNTVGRALVNPIMIQLGLLPAAAAISAAGVGAALLLPVAGIAAWGIAATKSNEQIRNAFGGLKDQVSKDSKEMGLALQPALIGVANEAQTAWSGLKPVFAGMFKDAAPLVTEFADGLVGLTANALPGMAVALKAGKPAIQGWNSLLKDTGSGLSDLFVEASKHSGAAKTGFEQLGTTVRNILGFVGQLIGLFTEAWAFIGGSFNGALKQTLDFVISFASGALPALGSGFKGILLLLQGIMSVLGPFAEFFGSTTGAILGAVAAYKLLSKATDGIGTGFNKAKTAVGKATETLRDSKIGVALMGDAYVKAAGDVDKATVSKGKLATAAGKAGNILGKVGNSLPIIGAAFVLLGTVIDEVSKPAEQLGDKLETGLQEALTRTKKRTDEVSYASREVANWTTLYGMRVQDMGTQSAEAATGQKALSEAVLKEKDAQNRAAEATKTHTQRLLDFFNALAGQLDKQVAYNNTVKDLKTKQDDLATAIKEHGKNSLEAKFATDEFNLSMANQVKAAGDLALANSNGKTEFEKLTAAAAATGLEAVKLIDIFGAKAPPALYQTVAAMSDTELQAIGGKRHIDNMGRAIIEVPGYKPIVIDSNMVQAANDALKLKDRVNEIPKGNVYLNYIIDTVVKGPGVPQAPFPLPGHAAGTEFFAGGLTRLHEQGPEIVELPRGSKIFTAQRSKGMMESAVREVLQNLSLPDTGGSSSITINPPPMPDLEWLNMVTRHVSRAVQQRVGQNG